MKYRYIVEGFGRLRVFTAKLRAIKVAQSRLRRARCGKDTVIVLKVKAKYRHGSFALEDSKIIFEKDKPCR